MIRETINKDTDFRQLVARKTIRQLAHIWNLETSIGTTVKAKFYNDGGGGTPYPDEYLELYASAKSIRSDYEVTGLTIAAASSYFNALEREAKSALQAYALTEEQAFILGDDATAETAGLTLNSQIGVTGSYKGLKQLLSSAISVANGGFNDASTVYGQTRSATSTAKQYKLNCRCVATSLTSTSALSVDNLNKVITESNVVGGKTHNRIFLCSERRLDEIADLIAPQGRFVIGANSVELDGGLSVLTWKRNKIIGSRLMTYFGVTSTNGTSVTFTDADNAMALLDMDAINFYNIAGVDMKHVPIMGSDSAQRADVEGGYFKGYGVFIMESFTTHGVIWNLTSP